MPGVCRRLSPDLGNIRLMYSKERSMYHPGFQSEPVQPWDVAVGKYNCLASVFARNIRAQELLKTKIL